MSTTDVVPNNPIGLTVKVLHVLRYAVSVIGRVIFSWYYNNKGETLPPISDDIIKCPATVIASKIRNKEITSVQVLEAFIRRIKDVNPMLNCFVEDRTELALKEAREVDELIRSGKHSTEQLERDKPFLGVPFTTKDCIAVKGLHHTAGIVLRKDVIANEDADAIKLLREKGAINIGLTNISEMCMWWESHNHIHGRTNNPYNTTRIVGGSSGGEGCMQGAAGSAFGIGSDIGGSIRMPAFFNGVFGHKPSRGIVSNKGQFPEAASDRHNSFLGIGPITRHALDLKPLLKIISGTNSEKLKLDQPIDISLIKIFYQIQNNAPLTDPVDPEIEVALKKVLFHFNEKYQIKAEEKRIDRLKKSIPIWLTLMKHDKDSFGKMIMGRDSTMSVVIELFKSIFSCSANTVIGLFTALVDNTGVQIGSPKFKHYEKSRNELEKTFTDMLGNNGIFLYPTHPTPAPYHNEPLLKPLNFCYTSIINCLGLPATHIPLGLNKEGLPIGIQVVANHNNDRLCLAVAEELDKVFQGWVEPHKTA